MDWIRGIGMRLRALANRKAVDEDLEREIRMHLEMETEKNIREGMAPEEARRRARIAFGNIRATQEDYRASFGFGWIEDGLADARFALRTLRHSPAIATAAILTLALGIGANAAIFSVVNAVILRPLPFPESDRLVMLWEENPEFDWYQADAAPANVLDWKEQVDGFADVASWSAFGSNSTLTGEGSPVLLESVSTSGNFFSVLGVEPAAGRAFRDEETWDTGESVAIIGHELWRDRFGADPSVIDRTIQLDGRTVRIVGVMPAGFAFPDSETDIWVPFAFDASVREQTFFRRAHWMHAVARLAPGVSFGEANAQLQTVAQRLQQQYPETNRVMGAGMTPLQEFLVQESRRPLLILLGAVALLLLISCANVGNLLLVQAAGQKREAALRLALGARPGRLIRQAVTHSLVLSALGGIAGLVTGIWGTRLLTTIQPPGLLPMDQVTMDWRVVGFVFAITTASGLLFGTAPMIWSSRRVPSEAMRNDRRVSGGAPGDRRWGKALVVTEVALALTLTIGAGLLVRSFQQLLEVDPGFDAEGVLAVQLRVVGPRYDESEKVVAFYDELVHRARSIPGVRSAAAASKVPLTDWGWTSQLSIDGRAPEYVSEVAHREVTPGYFATMGVPILRGRDFTDADRATSAPVVLINESLAREQFPGEDPIGKRVSFDREPNESSTWRTIVGVVGDERQTSLGVDTKIQVTAPLAQDPRAGMVLVVRSDKSAEMLVPFVRALVAELDPDLAISAVRTMDEVQARSLARQRFLMTMLLMFASVGLLLAIVGVYGVMAQVARGRVREMGIRSALGARVGELRWLVLRQGLRLVTLGLVIGVLAAIAATQTMSSLLYEVTPVDPVTFATVSALLLLSATIAAWLPARHASRSDPAVVLREE